MNLAKLSANGQITVPVDVRRDMKLREGDKVLFLRAKDGRYLIGNASEDALLEAQRAFAGAAESVGWESDDDVVDEVMRMRYGGARR